MDKTKLLISASLIMVAFLTDSCSPKGWDMYAPGENLTSLTKITDMEDICRSEVAGIIRESKRLLTADEVEEAFAKDGYDDHEEGELCHLLFLHAEEQSGGDGGAGA